jgi:hypothetical protein
VAIPADIDREDKIVWQLSARQCLILAVAALGVWSGVRVAAGWLSWWVLMLAAAPVTAAAVVLAIGRRDGVSADRWLIAALGFYRHTRPAPPESGGPANAAAPVGVRVPVAAVGLPARAVVDLAGYGGPGFGVVDLGPSGGLAAAAIVSGAAAFALRSPAEQEATCAAFAGWLNSVTGPAHIVVRALPLDLRDAIARVDAAVAELDEWAPALADAAAGHAAHLRELSGAGLLTRRVVLVLRQPPPPGPARSGPAAQARADRAAVTALGRRLAEAAELLGPAGVRVTPLDGEQLARVLRSAAHPWTDPDQHHPDGPGGQA